MFDELETTTLDVLDRHAAPALSVGELRELVARERPGFTPPPVSLAAALKRSDGSIRILATDSRRLGWMVPLGWVIPPPSEPSPRTLAGRLRRSLRQLGRRIEPGSSRALARWARMLREEERVRPALERLTKTVSDSDTDLRLDPRTPASGVRPMVDRVREARAPCPSAGPNRSTSRPRYLRPSRRIRAAEELPA